MRAQLEPIFLLYEGAAPFEMPDGPPDLEVEGTRLWRLPDEELGAAFADRRLLIADGHHRYETALAYHEEVGTPESGYMMVVLVSLEDPGLTIFPTHRVFEQAASRSVARGSSLRRTPRSRLESLAGDRTMSRQSSSTSRAGRSSSSTALKASSTSSSWTAWATRGFLTPPTGGEAVRAVDEGEAAVAVLMRPTRIEDVFQVAARGETMPQKSTYFYPKLTSGLLFHPLEP